MQRLRRDAYRYGERITDYNPNLYTHTLHDFSGHCHTHVYRDLNPDCNTLTFANFLSIAYSKLRSFIDAHCDWNTATFDAANDT